MPPSKDRQRKLAREKYERQLARRAQKQRRRRQLQAGVGVFLTLALVGVGSAWLLGAFESEPEPTAADDCTWLPQDTTANPGRIEVGTPDPNPPQTGTRTMTVDLAAGEAGSGSLEMVLEVDLAPCATASLEYLAAEGFYDDTTCHEIFDGAALRCGDPSGTGLGGPSYAYFSENLPPLSVEDPLEETEEPDGEPDPDAPDPGEAQDPADEEPAEDLPTVYPRGTLAIGDATGQHGSQFLIFFEDHGVEAPLYSILGTVTDGLDLLDAIAEAGTSDDPEAAPGTPAEPVRIAAVTVTDPDADQGGSADGP